MTEHRVLDYLNGDMSADDRRAFEADLAHDAQLRDELEQWLQIAQARQLDYNEAGLDRRNAAFRDLIESLAQEPAVAAPAVRPFWLRVKQWLWPGGPMTPLLPLGWALAVVMSGVLLMVPPTSEVGNDAQVRGAGNAVCARLAVDLPDTVTARQLRDVLVQYGAGIVSGPDESGRFVLSAPQAFSLTGAAKALGALSSTPEADGVCQRPMKP